MKELQLSLRFLSKKLPKSSPSSSSSTLIDFRRLYHSLSKINPHKLPTNKNSHILSPLHHKCKWRSSYYYYSGFFHAFPKQSSVSSAHLNKTFLGCSVCRFLTTSSSSEDDEPSFKLTTTLNNMPGFRPSSWILWFERQGYSVKGVLHSLIFANGAVFLMWQLSLDNLLSGCIYTLLTCPCSSHFGSNMIAGLLYFGKPIGKMFGSESLLITYLPGALSGCFCYALESLLRLLLQRIKNQEISGVDPLLGASGSVNGMVLAMLPLPAMPANASNIPMPAMILVRPPTSALILIK